MKHGKYFLFLLLSLTILLPLLLPLLAPGTPHEFDMFFHLERISEFYRQLTEGHLVPTWSTRLAYGFGSPVLMFNYSFPYYVASIPLWLGTTLLDSFKILTALTYIGMFGSMFLFLNMLAGPWAALVGATFYSWAPYHFDVVDHRGAIGETTAMVFWPLLFWATGIMFKKHHAKSFFISTLLWALLFYSHPDLFIMIFPLWFIVIVFEYVYSKNIHAL
ncbi:MAG: hypothetical protein AAB649_07460, partial [Patescibacteria group bacterium]